MSVVFRIGEEEPLFHVGEFPVRLITLLVALHSAAMVAASLLMATGHAGVLEFLTYSSAAVAHGQLWRVVSYAFVAAPSVLFLLEMLMLWYFGKEVENGLGWKRFGILYAGLVLLGPVLLQALSYSGHPRSFAGAQEVNFAVFAAFVTMHPSARFFFGAAARWVLLGLLAISSLQLLADHQEARVAVLLSTALLSILLVKKAGFTEPLFLKGFTWSLPWKKKSAGGFTVVHGGLSSKTSTTTARSEPSAPADPEQELDRLLEKIARSGMVSLDETERAALEKARRAMIRREGGQG